ncbi:MAG: protein-disulfide reductase DsbD family protein, partial [Dehalococcoidia bacterium]
MKKVLLPLFALLLFSANLFAQDEELLEPDKAFALTITPVSADTIQAHWDIAEGYYLYRSKLKFHSDTPGITLGEPQFPAGKIKHDEFFGDVEIYRGSLTVTIPVERGADAPATLNLTATAQGCADVGVCYPPQHQKRQVALPAQTASAPQAALSALSNQFKPLGGEEEILEPDQAFQFDASVEDGNTLLARWEIAPKHYLYKDKFRFALSNSDGVTLGKPQLPKGEEKDDEFFGRIEVYHNTVEAR